ncbi:hypothetical protein NX801_30030 [Streptomyces sp. LP05-1]|uniref:Uncharacterized protein n=1 Tax=Streptomyces pyxinae TaxID=2970734 RepID=A0ABT2CQU5_9ACTN|nr:hypothetical protein [Streptomyces sp. LP05-1]MCS0639803.1 hypothetical protein [Streptomyces sp. LP05-1]
MDDAFEERVAVEQEAVGSAFSDAVAHTSLVGAIVLGAGSVLVALLLPRRPRG